MPLVYPGRETAIALDNKGPEIRTGNMRDNVEVNTRGFLYILSECHSFMLVLGGYQRWSRDDFQRRRAIQGYM